ncbi:TetR/AcrR family transcriptional regulator [Agrobacterium tumefaciens]|uniref:TetR/AcrR family transcriptional regulator n=1 Tax=Agrobacterium tumefaciens TaxID=358 RepID=UPI00157348CD|nr:TetR/AcrR family transcriptional regulator [Agrobacterium tumefaciens]NSZ66544.1 TetR/AcrR family transcriptional regulator [Agrobacterium tumefaciens]NTA19434.1 TetR/AcrR family transcriptional regulator [Agrobacterium tumefaciens]NTA72916.1 TetR/AcrR family transcriptional regulator [Agrobacterium tumefaciens]WCK74333.1 TetR/AcrR family transcriptional regulator [Agrobacterium tumefaciens]WIE41464.1 TetR/AcrR family transcriptional regulator [Agrobacterium tumefaciens]
MSGKQQFDDIVVIDNAMKVFWRRGYAAASIDELTTAMGLSRSSLYKRFRDKEGLFHEVLATYNDRVLRRMAGIEAETRRLQIEALLLEFIPNAIENDKPNGCMLVKACVEIAELPPSGKAAALDGTQRQRVILRSILNAALVNGELSSSADVEALAWHFLGVLQAIMNLPQIGATVSDLTRMVASAMLAWPRAF